MFYKRSYCSYCYHYTAGVCCPCTTLSSLWLKCQVSSVTQQHSVTKPRQPNTTSAKKWVTLHCLPVVTQALRTSVIFMGFHRLYDHWFNTLFFKKKSALTYQTVTSLLNTRKKKLHILSKFMCVIKWWKLMLQRWQCSWWLCNEFRKIPIDIPWQQTQGK